MSINLDALKAPFAPSKISWRIGSTNADKSKGMALAYIDARDVQDRLDEVCGIGGWQNRYIPMHDKKTVCEIGILISRDGPCNNLAELRELREWVWKADGAGDSDVEAEKGALSDAFKRAAVKWGIGRYLYDIPSPWVEVDTYEKGGKVFVKGIRAAEHARLEALLTKAAGIPPRPPAASPKQPGGEIYAPEHIAVVSTPPARAVAAKSWALGEIPRIKGMDKPTLDKFSERFKKTREELKALDGKTSIELEKAISDRYIALFD